MTHQEMADSATRRLEQFILQARSGKPVRLSVIVYRSMVKQVVQSESTDDIQEASDMNLLMASFTPMTQVSGGPGKVSKVYAISPLNETEVQDKTIRHIANERLKMDYARLRTAGVEFEEKFF